jgi:magnesium-transporting ATPase (P-type)
MAVGVRHMARQKAIVRKLLALENIGSCTTISSDKTGTLTQGKMVVKEVYLPELGTFGASGEGYSPKGEIKRLPADDEEDASNPAMMASNMPQLFLRFTQCAALCNMSVIKPKGMTTEEQMQRVIYPKDSRKSSPTKKNFPVTKLKMTELTAQANNSDNSAQSGNEIWEAIGDPTEAALQAFAWKANLSKPSLQSVSTSAAPLSFELLQEFPFDATLKRMSVICQENHPSSMENDGKIYWTFVKGSLESVLPLCDFVMLPDGSISRLADNDYITRGAISGDSAGKESFERRINGQMEMLAEKGLVIMMPNYLFDFNVNYTCKNSEYYH